jgi:predicted amidohydrolase
VIICPAAWLAGPLKADHWRTLLRARAIENTAFVVGVGLVGPSLTGRSLAVGPDGVVLAELDEGPGLVAVDLDPAAVARVRTTNPSLANRRYTIEPH